MDREQEELQFLGALGIFKESFKIIFKWRKIFSQITLVLILPLSFFVLAHYPISNPLFFNFPDHEDSLYHDPKNSFFSYDELPSVSSSQQSAFWLWLFKYAYFIFLFILSLFSTSAVVFTLACIYTAKDITFTKVMSVVPKLSKRLMLTFIWLFAVSFVYNFVAGILLFFWVDFIGLNTIGIVVGVILRIIYLMGFVYIAIVWNLANVVSVLEDSYGKKAMIKSKALIKGKMGAAIAILLVLGVCFLGIQLVFDIFVVISGWAGPAGGIGVRVGVGILCLLFLFKVMLFGYVLQTLLYFVCKSYHHENIDKSNLAVRLQVYLGEYVPLEASNVQLKDLGV